MSDLDRNYYDSLNLTIARHPSETLERMVSRLMAYCIHAREGLVFTKGLSSVEEPDIWLHTLDDQLVLWIEVGEPTAERIKKASRLACEVIVYSFNSKSNIWWEQAREKLTKIEAVVFQFQWDQIQKLATLIQRTCTLSMTITESSAFVAAETGEVEITWRQLNQL